MFNDVDKSILIMIFIVSIITSLIFFLHHMFLIIFLMNIAICFMTI